MDSHDRNAIEELFRKIARVEQRSGPRDREADAFIRAQIASQPAAPYYMAQTIVVQQKALEDAEARIEELEGRAFEATRGRARAEGPWGAASGLGGGGFLAGAAQTAMGVAGGVLLGNMLGDWLRADPAEAAGNEASAEQDAAAETEVADAGDFGGDFDFGDF